MDEPTPSEKEVVEEEVKEESYDVPPPNKPLISFSLRFVKAEIET